MTNKTYGRVQFLRECSNVRRSHTLRQLQPYTLGQHSFGILLILAAIYENTGLPVPALLVRAAMYHDLSERYTGDTPATAKWGDPALRKELNRASTSYEFANNLRTYLPPELCDLLSWCDLFEFACNQLEELRLGNTYAAEYIQRAIENLNARVAPPKFQVSCADLLNGLTLEFARHDKNSK